ncbi:YitT family protein [Pseudacidovorax intermedius]|uniref:Membrane protein n=1 Tax=Pseudacidovorax intermedius TaxID=433924 RepID=A0A147GPP3_9BURK|nr:YitT family protein [Pseudacidovorax intermedius]KTT16200.1 membrane protein [Pseudacidovorax intermedius]
MDAPAPARTMAVSTPSLRHSRLEDIQALCAGTLFVAMALVLFGQAGLLTGGTAGAAFLLHYTTGVGMGLCFFLLNLPFYGFAWKQMGGEFTIKTFAAIALLSVLTETAPRFVTIQALHPAFAAVFGGLMLGTGCLFLARHRASLGGATVVALYLQERRGWRAGKVQLAIDCSVLLAALAVVPPARVGWSVLGAMVMGGFLWINHRPGRYVGS